MAAFLITNRQVISRGRSEKLRTDGKERAMPTFRVATLDVARRSYTLIPDVIDPDYTKIGTDAALRGSEWFVNELYRLLTRPSGEGGDEGDVLVYVHGFRNDLGDSIDAVCELHDQLAANPLSPVRHVVGVSWPAQDSLAAYRDDRRDAHETGIMLARVFVRVVSALDVMLRSGLPPCRHEMHLVGHSMGCYVVEQLLRTLGPERTRPFFREALLLNADVDEGALGMSAGLGLLGRLARRTHVYVHQCDEALNASHRLKLQGPRLGRRGPFDMLGMPPETYVVDMTEAGDAGRFQHNSLRASRVVQDDVRAVLRGVDEEAIPNRTPWTSDRRWFDLRER